jgi:adenylate cyclase class 2
MKEFETHILDVDKTEIAGKLEALGAKKVKDVLQKRMTFDFPDRRLDETRAWVRLRDTGEGKVELAYKCHKPSGAAGVADCDEVEFEVPGMEKVEQFLLLIGLERKSYQETKRTRYELDDLTFDLDEWPMIPPFVEVEGPSMERVMEGVRLLGYTEEQTFQGHAGDIYEMKGIDWKGMKEIKF